MSWGPWQTLRVPRFRSRSRPDQRRPTQSRPVRSEADQVSATSASCGTLGSRRARRGWDRRMVPCNKAHAAHATRRCGAAAALAYGGAARSVVAAARLPSVGAAVLWYWEVLQFSRLSNSSLMPRPPGRSHHWDSQAWLKRAAVYECQQRIGDVSPPLLPWGWVGEWEGAEPVPASRATSTLVLMLRRLAVVWTQDIIIWNRLSQICTGLHQAPQGSWRPGSGSLGSAPLALWA